MQQRCPNCGSPIAPGQRFCGVCGAQISLSCPQCRITVSPGTRFCPNCGATLGGGSQPQQPGWGQQPGGMPQQPGWGQQPGGMPQQPGWGQQPGWAPPAPKAQQSSSRSFLVILLIVLLIGLGGLIYWQFGDTILGMLQSSSPTTPTIDTTPLEITSSQVRNIGVVNAEIVWKTSKPASSQVEYWTTTDDVKATPIEHDPTTGQSLGVVDHVVQLTELEAGTSYNYKAKSKDTAGVEVTKEGTFQTQEMPEEEE